MEEHTKSDESATNAPVEAPSDAPNPRGDVPETAVQSTDDGFARPEDFQVTRDGKGQRSTTVTTLPNFGKVELVPMNYGDIQNYFGDGANHHAEAELIATIINEFMTRPEIHADETYVKEMYPTAPAEILKAVFRVSKVDAEVVSGPDGSAQVRVNQPGN